MATTTSALPDGTKLTKPAYTDSADIAVINTNMDNIANNINSLNSNIGNLSFVNINSEQSNLNNVPMNGYGRINLAASLSPNGSANYYDYYSSGTSSHRYLQVVGNGMMWFKTYNSGSWSEWKNELNRNIEDRFWTFAIYTGAFSVQNPGKIENVITNIPSGSGKYIILTFYPGYTFTDSVSLYFIQHDSTWFGLQEIIKGSGSMTVTISTDGTVAKGNNNTYGARLIAFRVST